MRTDIKRIDRFGFTLVELLVVIGIIAVLVAILLPVLSRVREAGNKAKCLSNQRQIGQAVQMYANDNRGYVFPFTYTGTNSALAWVHFLVLGKYATAPLQDPDIRRHSTGDSIFRCPTGVHQKFPGGDSRAQTRD